MRRNTRLDMSDTEKPEGAPKVRGVVDICFLVDATGSMQPCIDAIKANIRKFVEKLTTPDANGGVELADWRACICGYRDYDYEPKHGKEKLVLNNFTRDVSELVKQLEELHAEGGGDEPESLLDALYDVINRGKTDRGEDPKPEKWRYASSAARCIIVLTDASFHETMTVVPGAGLDDIINLIQQERIRLSLFAPEMTCHYQLSEADKCVYNAIPYDESNSKGAVEALRNFTSDEANFEETLALLAKSVSRSSTDIEIL